MVDDYDYLEEVVLLFWDEPDAFWSKSTQQKIGVSLFKEVFHINSVEDVDNVFGKYIDAEQKFLVLVHLYHSRDNSGVASFRESKILKKYPSMRYYFISSVPKSDIFRTSGNELDVFSYDNFHQKIGRALLPQTRSEIVHEVRVDHDTGGKKGIFLSHSSNDLNLVDRFRELILQGALNYDLNYVKCTGVEDHNIAGGNNIPENLRKFMKDEMGLFIQFISESYVASRVCLNEEGAGWCLVEDGMFIPIILPDATFENLSWVKLVNKAIRVDEKPSLLNIYENRKWFFPDVNVTRLNKKIDEFLTAL